MKIAYCADVHIGNPRIAGGSFELAMNARCRETLAVLREATLAACEAHANQLVILGDLFDTEKPPPQMISAMQAALCGIHVIAIPGNHDQVSGRLGDHALGSLQWGMLSQVAEEPTSRGLEGKHVQLLIPFQQGDPTEWLPVAVAGQLGRLKGPHKSVALCIHLGLRDESARKITWAAEATDAVDVEWLAELCFQYDITHVFAGNWHVYDQWRFSQPGKKDVLMTQCGALVPTGWDNPGLTGYGGLIFYDTETGAVERQEIPGPRFVKIYSEAELDDLPTDQTALYVRWVCAPADAARANAVLQEAREGSGPVHAYSVDVDSTQIREKARVASRAASSSQTLGEALTAYVAELELPDGVHRASVGERCRRYLDIASGGGAA